MKKKNNIPANGDELPIRNSTTEFLFFAKDSGADTISVRFQLTSWKNKRKSLETAVR